MSTSSSSMSKTLLEWNEKLLTSDFSNIRSWKDMIVEMIDLESKKRIFIPWANRQDHDISDRSPSAEYSNTCAKYIKKYMRLARFSALDSPVCPSRSVGAVIVDSASGELDGSSFVLGIGVNGPPAGIPHCDTDEHYINVLLNDEDVCNHPLLEKYETPEQKLTALTVLRDHNIEKDPKKACPRKLLGYTKPGEKPNLCTCIHAERNAIDNCSTGVKAIGGLRMFCWCGIPCKTCAESIVQNRIETIYCLDQPDEMLYSKEALWILGMGHVRIVLLNESQILDGAME